MTNRVWFDARSLSRGYTSGWERYVRELAKYLPRLIDITLWTPKTNNRLSLILSDRNNFRSQNGHKVVHYPTYPPLKINQNLKKIITLHDLTWWNYPETSSFLGKHYYKKNMEKAIGFADLIIVPSNFIKFELNKKFSISLEKIHVIPHGNSLPKGLVNKTNKPYFLSVGTIEPRKNLDFYSKAIEQSALKNKFDFIHVGRKGWGQMPNNLIRFAAKTDQELANLISNARALVIPSKYEGFGLPVLEAHAQGIPVIMSDIGALKELSNKQDLIFKLTDINTFVNSLIRFATEETRLDPDLIEEARSYTWLNSAQLHVKTYNGLLYE